MNLIRQAQTAIQEYADTIASVLAIETTIVDEKCVRVAGTGPYKEAVDLPLPHGSFYRQILASARPGVIQDNQQAFACKECDRQETCGERATMGYPIMLEGQAIGVIGLIAFTPQQQARISESPSELLAFLGHMANLLQSKLELMAQNQRLMAQMQEALNLGNQRHAFHNLMGREARFLSVLDKGLRAALSQSTVLITGESGTGKELLARAIHGASARQHKPFVAVNCASVPENLMESELFGYEGGAFTGAKKEGKPGKFELAQGGTLFLDEIGDLPLAMQPKLLRVIQERVLERVGGGKALPLNVRLIAATNKDLKQAVSEGLFREELYYRLNVIPLHLPALRERREDIEGLAIHFLHKYEQLLGKQGLVFSQTLVERLKDFSWPGNIRQLENAVEYMVNMAAGPMIGPEDLPEYFQEDFQNQPLPQRPLKEMLEEYEGALLKDALRQAGWPKDKGPLARRLGLSQATLYRKLKDHGLQEETEKG